MPTPTEPGWYWTRVGENWVPILVPEAEADDVAAIIARISHKIVEEWGPRIPPPEELAELLRLKRAQEVKT